MKRAYFLYILFLFPFLIQCDLKLENGRPETDNLLIEIFEPVGKMEAENLLEFNIDENMPQDSFYYIVRWKNNLNHSLYIPTLDFRFLQTYSIVDSSVIDRTDVWTSIPSYYKNSKIVELAPEEVKMFYIYFHARKNPNRIINFYVDTYLDVDQAVYHERIIIPFRTIYGL